MSNRPYIALVDTEHDPDERESCKVVDLGQHANAEAAFRQFVIDQYWTDYENGECRVDYLAQSTRWVKVICVSEDNADIYPRWLKPLLEHEAREDSERKLRDAEEALRKAQEQVDSLRGSG